MQVIRFILPLVILIIAFHSAKALPSSSRVERNTKLWSDWSAWSTCSRDCGSGLTTQQRSCISGCDEPEENEVRYQSCCIQECPEGTKDFLLQQCLSVGAGNWTSAVKDGEECGMINCQREVAGTIVQTQSVGVAAGTPCTPKQGGRGMCLGNHCAVLGCDGILGSRHEEDECLNCLSPEAATALQGGAGTCQARTGTYPFPLSTTTPPPGDLPVLHLRESYTSISISHPFNAREGRLALSSTFGQYFFRGGNSGSEFDIDGVRFHYRIVQESEDVLKEELTTRGPLTQDIRVLLLDIARGASPTVFYTYHLSGEDETVGGARNHTHPPPSSITEAPSSGSEFVWQQNVSECSVTCGRGFRTLDPVCVDIGVYPERKIDPRHCKSSERPLPIVETCHLRNCSAHWETEEWSPCSRECGGGEQSRRVYCKQQVVVEDGGVEHRVVDSTHCDQSSKPEEVRGCNPHSCDFTWATGEWSECSEERFDGVQERRVECQESASGQATRNPAHCGEIPKPLSIRVCRLANCHEDGSCYSWKPRKWYKCNNACGYGNQTRKVVCLLDGKKKVNESFCVGLRMPPARRECWSTRGSKCDPHWDVGPYGQCTGDCCEDNFKHRTVQCVDLKNGEQVLLPDEACANHTTKPVSKETCSRPDCPHWRTGPWGDCTGRCDQIGMQTREVFCEIASTGQRLGHAQCCQSPPLGARPCQIAPCTPPPCIDASFCPAIEQEDCNTSFFRDACCQFCSS